VPTGIALHGLPVPEQNGIGMKSPSEPLRAWAWHVVAWAAIAVAIAALVLGGVLAVQQLGTAIGITATLLGAVLGLGTLTWLGCGKARP
jgi:hypothetical protein